MKKFFSLGLALVMSACFCNFALAAETSDVQDCAYVIQVDSQEEYDRIVAEIDAANMRAKLLWQQALVKSLLPENIALNLPSENISSRSYTTRLVPYSGFIAYTGNYDIVFKVTATEGLDDCNHTIFKSIRDVTAYPKDDKTSIEVDDTDSKIIDGGRTIAANYSTTIGITTKTGVMEYYSRLFYVEFYNHTGSGNMGRVF